MAHEKSRKLNSKQLIAANLIGQGLRQKEVATHLNMRGETISRWSQQPNFRKHMRKARMELTQSIMAENLKIFDKCHQVINEALDGPDKPIARASLAIRYLNNLSKQRTPYDELEDWLRDEEFEKESDESFRWIIEIINQLSYLRASFNDYNEDQLKTAINDIIELARVKRPINK